MTNGHPGFWRLPEAYRAAVVLRDVERLSTAEAAELLGLREAAFKSRLHRGRMKLRADVAGYVVDEDSPTRSSDATRAKCSKVVLAAVDGQSPPCRDAALVDLKPLFTETWRSAASIVSVPTGADPARLWPDDDEYPNPMAGDFRAAYTCSRFGRSYASHQLEEIDEGTAGRPKADDN